MKKIIAIFIVMVFIISNNTNAGTHNGMSAEKRNELRKSIEKYRDDNIFPKMLEWKAKIDKSLNSDELSKLNKLREEFRISKDENKKKMDEMKSQMFKGSKIDKEKFHDMMDEYRDKMKEFGKKVKPIAITHLEEFKKIGEEAKPFKSKWKEDLKKVFEDWKKTNNIEGDGHNMKGFGGMMNMEGKEKLMALYMILWDGNKDHFMNEMEVPNQNFRTMNSNDDDVNAYPNPTDKVANIDFSLKNKEQVKVTISDRNGNVVATLVNNELAQGFHSLSFNPTDFNLSNGMYIYKIESSSLNKSGKLILNK